MPLDTSATAKEAQAAAGHGFAQWARFYVHTSEAAELILREHPERTWISLPANEKSRIKDSINHKLASEGAPCVDEDIIHWRMSLAVRNKRKWAMDKAAAAAPDTRATTLEPTPAPALEQTPVRPYDPIRDV